MRFLKRLTVVPLLLILLLGLFSCSDDDNPTNGENNPPTIASLTASPATFRSGETCTLQVAASDPDGDQLAYLWDHRNGQEKLAWVSASGNTAVLGTCGCPVPFSVDAWVVSTVEDGRGGTARDSVAVVLLPEE